MIPVFEPRFVGNEKKYVEDCLKSTFISSVGKYIPKLESDFSGYIGVKHGIACNTGTAAINIALESLELPPGSEVIMPSFTIIACANMAISSCLKPVFVDSEKDTWNIDPDKIEEKITDKTKVIMPVHIYGHPCNMREIMKIAEKHDLKVVEDCSESHGATFKGKMTGSFGDLNAFSFYANKVITTGEGGMVVTKNKKLAEKARLLINQGFTKPRFKHYVRGYNYRMSNLLAAVGVAQLEKINWIIKRKREIAYRYLKNLKHLKTISLPVEKDYAKNIYWMFSILIRDSFGSTRDMVMEKLSKEGIETRPFFYPLHKQPVFIENKHNNPYYPETNGILPVAEGISEKGLYLPSGLNLTNEQIDFISKKLISLSK